MTGQPEKNGGSATRGYSSGSVTTLTPEQKAKARIRVAGRAKSPDDCELLLDALGLLPSTDPDAAP